MAESMNDRECRMMAEFFTIFSNPTRLQVFCALQDGRKTVSALAEHAGVSLSNVSQHLRLMRDKGAVVTEKEGQHVFYTLVDPRFVEAAGLIRDALIEAMQRRMDTVDSAE